MIRDIHFIGRALAEKFVVNGAAAVISIRDPSKKMPYLSRKFKKMLFLEFDDDTESSCGLSVEEVPDLMNGHENGRRVMINGNELSDFNDAKQIIALLQELSDVDELYTLVVHCEFGISRSAAVAQFAAERFGGQIVSRAHTTSGKNSRLYRLLNKAYDGAEPLVGNLPEGHLEMKKRHMY